LVTLRYGRQAIRRIGRDSDYTMTNNNNNNDNSNNQHQHNCCSDAARSLYRGLALAPMVRASTTPLRILALQYGADFTYTEELVDRSISQTIRVENKHLNTIDYVKDPSTLSKKTRRKLESENNRPCLILRIDPEKEKKKLVCQLGTGEPYLALQAATHVIRDVSAIDINMGCPRKFSVSGGMGAALLEDPDRAARILKKLKNDLLKPLNKPLSCKIRLLENTQKTVDFVEGMINAGADAVAIHGRRPGHDQINAADWDTLEEVIGLLRPKYPTFNFLVNGDFYDRKERIEFVQRTKVDGVLLGRPALYNTSIFLPLTTTGTGSTIVEAQQQPLVDKTTVVQEYLRKSVRYDVHYKNAKYVVCEMMGHRRTVTARVPYLPINFPGGQTIAKTCNSHDIQTMCQVWNVNYSDAFASITNTNTNTTSSSTETIANGILTDVANANADTTPPITLAAGEHRYEDSYFLKKRDANEVDDADEEKKSSDEKLRQQVDGNNDNDNHQVSKRAKVL
jgi:tRNA-dihydrouridine synthase 2